MRNRNITTDEVNDFFNELQMEDLMGRMARSFSENFMVAGEVTEKLDEIVQRAPDSLLDLILETLNCEESQSMERKEKEKEAAERIVEAFQEEFFFLDKSDLEILLKAGGGGEISPMEMTVIGESYVKKGWIFMFQESADAYYYVLPEELRKIIRTNIENENSQMELAYISMIRMSLKAGLNLYGVFERTQVRLMIQNMMEENAENPEEMEDNLKLLENAEPVLDILLDREEGFWLDGDYIVSDSFEDEEDYRELLRLREGKVYYRPSLSEIIQYADEEVNTSNTYYKKVLAELKKIMQPAYRGDNLMFEIEYKAVEEGMRLTEILDLLKERAVEFPNRSRAEEFAANCSRWLFGVRRWKHAGHSDEEMGLSIETLPVFYDLNALVRPGKAEMKIRKPERNDPCPCGSGKKYKKCCGK